MRSERRSHTFFKSQHFGGFIGILLAAHIAPNHDATGKSRRSRVSIRLTEGDSMPKKTILLIMKTTVLADYHPAIVACVPHSQLQQDISANGCGGNRWCE